MLWTNNRRINYFLKIFNIQKPVSILQSNWRNTNWIVAPVTQVKSGEHFAKLNTKAILNRAHFVVLLSRRCQNVLNGYETIINTNNSLLKTFLKYYSLSWLYFKTSQALRLKENDNSVTKSFRLSTKRKLSILFNFLFPVASFNNVFSTLKCNSLVLETTAWSTSGSHFVEKGILHYRAHLGVKPFYFSYPH